MILLVYLGYFNSAYGQLKREYKTPMPIRTTNCAVAYYKGKVYVFGALDSSKLYSGIHQKSYVYDTLLDTWSSLPDMPDTLGKIAASASELQDTIYIVGGYHVYANGNEKSSNRVHRFVPAINQFINDATPIPIAIDDHIQDVWRDSLLYIITGWSNTTNVPNVQIFNPHTNSWSVGTPTPNTNNYKCFGGAGLIYKDTIYYFGGAAIGNNFPITNYLRKGIINPSNPNHISWSIDTISNIVGYRMGAAIVEDKIYFIGGSTRTYNYDGIAYNGSGIAPINSKSLWYHLPTKTYGIDSTLSVNKDYRNMVSTGAAYYLMGGIDSNNMVSNACIKLSSLFPLPIINDDDSEHIMIWPNPSSSGIHILNRDAHQQHVKILTINGICIYESLQAGGSQEYIVLNSGNYIVQCNKSSQIILVR
jgi:hypothetical protein